MFLLTPPFPSTLGFSLFAFFFKEKRPENCHLFKSSDFVFLPWRRLDTSARNWNKQKNSERRGARQTNFSPSSVASNPCFVCFFWLSFYRFPPRLVIDAETFLKFKRDEPDQNFFFPLFFSVDVLPFICVFPAWLKIWNKRLPPRRLCIKIEFPRYGFK